MVLSSNSSQSSSLAGAVTATSNIHSCLSSDETQDSAKATMLDSRSVAPTATIREVLLWLQDTAKLNETATRFFSSSPSAPASMNAKPVVLDDLLRIKHAAHGPHQCNSVTTASGSGTNVSGSCSSSSTGGTNSTTTAAATSAVAAERDRAAMLAASYRLPPNIMALLPSQLSHLALNAASSAPQRQHTSTTISGSTVSTSMAVADTSSVSTRASTPSPPVIGRHPISSDKQSLSPTGSNVCAGNNDHNTSQDQSNGVVFRGSSTCPIVEMTTQPPEHHPVFASPYVSTMETSTAASSSSTASLAQSSFGSMNTTTSAISKPLAFSPRTGIPNWTGRETLEADRLLLKPETSPVSSSSYSKNAVANNDNNNTGRSPVDSPKTTTSPTSLSGSSKPCCDSHSSPLPTSYSLGTGRISLSNSNQGTSTAPSVYVNPTVAHHRAPEQEERFQRPSMDCSLQNHHDNIAAAHNGNIDLRMLLSSLLPESLYSNVIPRRRLPPEHASSVSGLEQQHHHCSSVGTSNDDHSCAEGAPLRCDASADAQHSLLSLLKLLSNQDVGAALSSSAIQHSPRHQQTPLQPPLVPPIKEDTKDEQRLLNFIEALINRMPQQQQQQTAYRHQPSKLIASILSLYQLLCQVSLSSQIKDDCAAYELPVSLSPAFTTPSGRSSLADILTQLITATNAPPQRAEPPQKHEGTLASDFPMVHPQQQQSQQSQALLSQLLNLSGYAEQHQPAVLSTAGFKNGPQHSSGLLHNGPASNSTYTTQGSGHINQTTPSNTSISNGGLLNLVTQMLLASSTRSVQGAESSLPTTMGTKSGLLSPRELALAATLAEMTQQRQQHHIHHQQQEQRQQQQQQQHQQQHSASLVVTLPCHNSGIDVSEITRSLRDDGRYAFDAQLRTHKPSSPTSEDSGPACRGGTRRACTEYLCTYPGVSWNTRMQSWLVYYEDAKGRKSRTFNPKRLTHSQLEVLPPHIREKYATDPVEVAMHCACVYAARVRWEGRLRKSLGFHGTRSQPQTRQRSLQHTATCDSSTKQSYFPETGRFDDPGPLAPPVLVESLSPPAPLAVIGQSYEPSSSLRPATLVAAPTYSISSQTPQDRCAELKLTSPWSQAEKQISQSCQSNQDENNIHGTTNVVSVSTPCDLTTQLSLSSCLSSEPDPTPAPVYHRHHHQPNNEALLDVAKAIQRVAEEAHVGPNVKAVLQAQFASALYSDSAKADTRGAQLTSSPEQKRSVGAIISYENKRQQDEEAKSVTLAAITGDNKDDDDQEEAGNTASQIVAVGLADTEASSQLFKSQAKRRRIPNRRDKLDESTAMTLSSVRRQRTLETPVGLPDDGNDHDGDGGGNDDDDPDYRAPPVKRSNRRRNSQVRH